HLRQRGSRHPDAAGSRRKTGRLARVSDDGTGVDPRHPERRVPGAGHEHDARDGRGRAARPIGEARARSSAVDTRGTDRIWSSVQGLGNGFIFLVLVVAALVREVIGRRFTRAALWCLLAAAFSSVGLMHSAVARWGAQPVYAAGWLAAAVIVYTAKWWGAD